MKVGGDVSLCVEYKHCAYLGGDTTCSGAPHGYGYGYGAQSYSNSVSYAYGYGSSNGCTGNATWQVIAPGGDPSCGAPHAVTRCAPAAGGTCALVTGVTVDVADP
jgi:hypothetical protein